MNSPAAANSPNANVLLSIFTAAPVNCATALVVALPEEDDPSASVAVAVAAAAATDPVEVTTVPFE